jgi:DNA-binding MarR family transcriptional regulator
LATNNLPEHHQRARLLEIMYITIQTLSWESHKQSTDIMKELDLTLPQGLALLTLHGLGNRAKMSELIELIQISGGTLTGIVDRLITAGLVARERDETDRRVVYVSLTEAGAKKVQAVQHTHRVQLDRATAGFSNHELAQFNDLLTKFVAATPVPPEAFQNYPEFTRSYDLTLAESSSQPAPGLPGLKNPGDKDLSGKPL